MTIAELEGQYSRQEIETVIKMYYKRVRSEMIEANNLRLNLNGLGSLLVYKSKVKKVINASETMLETKFQSNSSGSMLKTREDLLRRIERMKKFMKLFSKEDELREQKRQEREEYEQNKKDSGSGE